MAACSTGTAGCSESSSSLTSSSTAIVNRKRYYCGHCDEYLSKTVYFQHRRLYFEVKCQKWSKKRLFACAGRGESEPTSAEDSQSSSAEELSTFVRDNEIVEDSDGR